MTELSHVDSNGKAQMVDVGDKEITSRTASANVVVTVNNETFDLVKKNNVAKGDVLTTAKIAGIQAAKRTSELIPLCHPLPLDHVDLTFDLDSDTSTITIRSFIRCTARTGAEMEALTACSVAALTIYDMLKAAQKDITITDLMLLHKEGGKSGEYYRQDS